MSAFDDSYARHYDVLYADKDYAAEARYVSQRLRGHQAGTTSVLEFGSGTGRHARLLAADGFDVVGIERSASMLARAASDTAASVRFVGGDIRSCHVGHEFDCVIALFHVVCYMQTDTDILAAFANARHHLRPGGTFLFDFWYGPAVLKQGIETRVKEITTATACVVRQARATLDDIESRVEVQYSLFHKDSEADFYRRSDEVHTLRYLFLPELRYLLSASGFKILDEEEWLTGRPLSSETWNGTVLAEAL